MEIRCSATYVLVQDVQSCEIIAADFFLVSHAACLLVWGAAVYFDILAWLLAGEITMYFNGLAKSEVGPNIVDEDATCSCCHKCQALLVQQCCNVS